MAKEKPINAGVPGGETPEPPAKEPSSPAKKTKPGQRRPIPLPLKLIGAAVIAATAFVVIAILGGSGAEESAGPGPSPVSNESGGRSGNPAAQASEELGYPAFATSNTTRVGGGDPAANAAGVALATFPSGDDSQKPDAVVLVDEDDWGAAIAASVLVADPVRAPVLISSEEMPDATAQALEALDPQGSKATGGAQAFAIGEVTDPDGLRTTRVQGSNPAAVAAKVAKLRDRLFDKPPSSVVVVPAGKAGFAMPAAAWAARSGDPVLLSGRDKLPKPSSAALKRYPDARVFVLGPPSAISTKAFREIAKINGKVRRVSGEDPVANSIAFARYDNGEFGWNINDPGHGFVVARDDEPLNAAAAAPLSASGTWGPLLLSDDADTLPKALRGYFLDVKPGYTDDPTRAFYNHVWVIGDQEAIDVKQQGEIDELAELAKIGQ